MCSEVFPQSHSLNIFIIPKFFYAERLALLDLELLELCRLRFDLIYYYKVMNHLTPFNPSDVLIVYSPDARSRSNHPYLQKPAKATNRLLSIFSSEALTPGTLLPPALRSSPTLPAFKRGLKHFDLSAFLKGSASRSLSLSAIATCFFFFLFYFLYSFYVFYSLYVLVCVFTVTC
jgi:hypothetical protein